jgi:hypothetical protein
MNCLCCLDSWTAGVDVFLFFHVDLQNAFEWDYSFDAFDDSEQVSCSRGNKYLL